MKFINLLIKGIFVGVANVIPGVSGGTIAVVLRIFDEMIEAINNFHKNFKKYASFLIPLGIGACIGILLFSKLVEYCLTKYSIPTNLFFIGLVTGSIPLIYKKASTKKIRPIYFGISLISFLIVAGISLLKEPTNLDSVIVVNTSLMVKLFIGGIIASAAMVIPGISGSFVMMLLGMYTTVISAVSSINTDFVNSLKILIPAGIGIIIGILLISKVIEILIAKVFSITYFSILGLIFGSIFAIFKDPVTYQSGVNITIICISVITFVIGFALSIILGKE